MDGLGAGLAAFAFWGFIAAIVVAGVWDSARKRDTQHETLRRIIESGKPVDQELLDKLLGNVRAPKRPDVALRVGAILLLSVAVGVAILGVFIGQLREPALMPMLGAASLVACIGIGFLIAAGYVRRAQEADANATQRSTRNG